MIANQAVVFNSYDFFCQIKCRSSPPRPGTAASLRLIRLGSCGTLREINFIQWHYPSNQKQIKLQYSIFTIFFCQIKFRLSQFTVWKFKNFFANQILHEINFIPFRSPKNWQFDHFAILHLQFLILFDMFKYEIPKKSKFKASKIVHIAGFDL